MGDIADKMYALASEIGSRVEEGGVNRDRYLRLRELAAKVLRLESQDELPDMLKIYKLSQTENCGYGTYDSCVVIAESEEDARQMNPGGNTEWGEEWTQWCHSPDQVEVEFIGTAPKSAKPGIVIASFNAG